MLHAIIRSASREWSFNSLSLSLSRFPRAQRGFTLIEIAIVLVVIGLLIGGILIGQSLIESAKLGKFVRQLQQYEIAAQQFKLKFNHIPGEMREFNLSEDYAQHIEYFNVDGILGDGGVGDRLDVETRYFFPNLSASGMLSEQYSDAEGAPTDSGRGHAFPTPVLGGKRAGINCAGCFFMGIAPLGTASGEYWWFVGAILAGSNSMPAYDKRGSFFYPEEAQAVDAKIDDGDPLTGDVLATMLHSTDSWPAITASDPPRIDMRMDTSPGPDGAAVCLSGGKYDISKGNAQLCNLLIRPQLKLIN